MSLAVYDVLGRRVRELTPAGWFEAGEHRVNLNAGNMPTGTYLLQIESNETRRSNLLQLIR